MIKVFEKLLGIIYYRTCHICGKDSGNDFVCGSCADKIKYFDNQFCYMNGDVKIYVCCEYKDVIKKLILGHKYHGKKQLTNFLANILYERYKTFCGEKKYIVIPVPVHKKRKRERGYNHMELTGDKLAGLCGAKTVKNLLIREKETKKQYNLNEKERFLNIKGAFRINPKLKVLPPKNSSLLIIDDIRSTGATLEEIIKVLKGEGYTDITGLVISSPVLKY